MRRIFSANRIALALAAVALLAVAGGAYAATANKTISICVKKKGGSLYKASRCARGDAKLTWNEVGPTGPQGATGAKGATGDTGATGATGANGATGATGARGVQGNTGVQGAIGPQGPPGVSNYSVESQTTIVSSSASVGSVTATCPAGDRVLGGGGGVPTPTAMVVFSSAPASGPTVGWTVEAGTTTGDSVGGLGEELYAYVMCGQVTPAAI